MKYDWSKQRLEETVTKANCWFNWLRILGIQTAGCNYRTLKNKAIEYGINTSHFNYDYAHTHNGKLSTANLDDDEIFSNTIGHHKNIVKREYIIRKLKGVAKCEICGISNWMNKQIVFQIHHINGNSKNNRVENLQLLCPNCHSQTENYSNKKKQCSFV